jgi:hypothetical protein
LPNAHQSEILSAKGKRGRPLRRPSGCWRFSVITDVLIRP